eukprot:100966-Amphidinium_carterae.1
MEPDEHFSRGGGACGRKACATAPGHESSARHTVMWAVHLQVSCQDVRSVRKAVQQSYRLHLQPSCGASILHSK